MFSLYEIVAIDHDFRFVALAIGICALASLTGVAIAQHSMKPHPRASRLFWLVLAGSIIGLGIWATDFTALLGFRTDLNPRFDLLFTALSLVISASLIMIGGVTVLSRRDRGTLAGAWVGAGIAVTHFMNMNALRVPGSIVETNLVVVVVAAACGIVLAGCGGNLLVRFRDEVFAWPAAVMLFFAVLVTYLVAMSGVTVLPGDPSPDLDWTASGAQLAWAVVTAFLILLAAVIVYTLQADRAARTIAKEHAQLQKALAELKESQRHHRATVELSPQIAWVADPDGNITEVAPRWGDLVGQSPESAIGYHWMTYLHPDDLPSTTLIWRRALLRGGDEGLDVRYRVRLAEGNYRWFRARARPRRDGSGKILAWYGSLEDVHDQVVAELALRDSEERYRLAALATNEVIWEWSFDLQQATWSGAYMDVLGYPELAQQTGLEWWLEHIHPDDLPRVLASQGHALKNGADSWSEEYRFLIASGDWIDVRTRCVIVRSGSGEPTRLVGSMLDITQQKRAEAELNWAAFHDPLTKLPNRTLFRIRKKAAIDAARDTGKFVALIVLDLNDFKQVNDTLGHSAGDHILEETAKRLRACVAPDVTIARLGGDEFAIILPNLSSPQDYIEPMARIGAILGKSISFQNMHVQIRHCAGVALWPRDGEEIADLLIAADLALYAAKSGVPGTVVEFDPSLRDASERRAGMLAAAKLALEEDRVVPYYQPKIDLQTGDIIGWEALLRIRKESIHILPPSEIAAAFSDAEIGVQLTDRMFSKVLSDLASWHAQGIDVGRIAINLSGGDFRQQGLSERVRSLAEQSGVTLDHIELEVTETVLIGDFGHEVSRELQALRDWGALVALDDFGTGYASLTHLQQLPVDVIKIDRSFIEKIDSTDLKATTVIDAVVQMAKRLGIQTVAEGVETWEQVRYLKASGCSIVQGYLFSPPISATKVPDFLTSTEPKRALAH